MSIKEKESLKSGEIMSRPSSGSLFPFNEFDDFFDEFLTHRWPHLSGWNFPTGLATGLDRGFPKVDILDCDNRVEVQAALPGIDKKDINISIDNQLLTISTSTKKEEEEKKEGGQYFRREITRGEFQRTLPLPGSVDNENVKATFKDGILKVIIPKTEKSKRKSIEIK